MERYEPLQSTVEPVTNPVPVTVSVSPAPPAGVVSGESEVMVGTGFPGTTEKVPLTTFDAFPFASKTCTRIVYVVIAVVGIAEIGL